MNIPGQLGFVSILESESGSITFLLDRIPLNPGKSNMLFAISIGDMYIIYIFFIVHRRRYLVLKENGTRALFFARFGAKSFREKKNYWLRIWNCNKKYCSRRSSNKHFRFGFVILLNSTAKDIAKELQSLEDGGLHNYCSYEDAALK